jgi:hypothetical protein
MSLVVVTPGTPFDAVWLAEWDELHFYLRTHFAFGHIYSQSNNIYQVRIEAARAHLIYLNPAAHVEHLKLGPVEPPRHDLIPISGFRPKQLEEVAV